jgi:hypothetical protein
MKPVEAAVRAWQELSAAAGNRILTCILEITYAALNTELLTTTVSSITKQIATFGRRRSKFEF